MVNRLTECSHRCGGDGWGVSEAPRKLLVPRRPFLIWDYVTLSSIELEWGNHLACVNIPKAWFMLSPGLGPTLGFPRSSFCVLSALRPPRNLEAVSQFWLIPEGLPFL